MAAKKGFRKGPVKTRGALSATGKRTYVSQGDVPSGSLHDALRIAQALGDNFAYQPTTPLNVAAALSMQPGGGQFRLLCGAAIAYGLTEGGANAPQIGLTSLGLKIIRPLNEGDDVAGRRAALLTPRVIGEFLRKYNNAQVPREDIGRNVLIQMGVPTDRARDALKLILDAAEAEGLLRVIKDKKYVDLSAVSPVEARHDEGVLDEDDLHDQAGNGNGDVMDAPAAHAGLLAVPPARGDVPKPGDFSSLQRRVFVTHGNNKALVEPIKKLLGFGELDPVVSVDRGSVSQPVPDKVMRDMRSCGAAIIHVDIEQIVTDKQDAEHALINPNVLIEIGAAMALYGRRYILLVKKGVRLPSNLQGLFEVRYEGAQPDAAETIQLLEAMRDIKNHPIPDRYQRENETIETAKA